MNGDRSGTKLGHYAIGRLLGRGGMGEVYLARDERRRRDVALKLLHAAAAQDIQFRERFTRESETVARLAHPNVIPIHDFGEIDGVLFLDMRLVEGRNLSEQLHDGPMTPPQAVALVEQIGGALDAAHRVGLIHRDVKPANIQLTEAGFPYLLDFGLAVTDGDDRITSTGIFVGSQAYAAPERFGGDPPTIAGDVYSLACVLYEALTGHPPFQATSLGQIVTQHLTAPVPRPSIEASVSPAMDAVVARGLAKNPAARTRSCGELAAAARAALQPATAAAAATDQNATVLRAAAQGPRFDPPDPGLTLPPSGPPAWAYASNPTEVPPGDTRRSSRVLPILAVVAAVLVGVSAVMSYAVLGNRDDTGSPGPVTSQQLPPPGSGQPGAVTSAVPAPPNPTEELRSRAAADRPLALASINNQWVPQLSTKYAGLSADGRIWDDAAIAEHVNELDDRYGPVRLLFTDDWPVFELRNAWVVVADQTFTDPNSALGWCRTEQLTDNECLAKFVSSTAGPEGTTFRQ